jgi:hypothetical protein
LHPHIYSNGHICLGNWSGTLAFSVFLCQHFYVGITSWTTVSDQFLLVRIKLAVVKINYELTWCGFAQSSQWCLPFNIASYT